MFDIMWDEASRRRLWVPGAWEVLSGCFEAPSDPVFPLAHEISKAPSPLQIHQTQVKIKRHLQLFIHRLLTNYRQGSTRKLTLKNTDLRGKHLAPRAECNFRLAESNHIYLWFYYL